MAQKLPMITLLQNFCVFRDKGRLIVTSEPMGFCCSKNVAMCVPWWQDCVQGNSWIGLCGSWPHATIYDRESSMLFGSVCSCLFCCTIFVVVDGVSTRTEGGLHKQRRDKRFKPCKIMESDYLCSRGNLVAPSGVSYYEIHAKRQQDNESSSLFGRG